jgi:hypothetical protein
MRGRQDNMSMQTHRLLERKGVSSDKQALHIGYVSFPRTEIERDYLSLSPAILPWAINAVFRKWA